jgi:hypothetical protein
MKRLISLVLTGALFAGCSTLPKITEMTIPRKFLGYNKTPATVMAPLKEGSTTYIQKAWDLDNDKDSDVIELYLMPNSQPIFYAFDINDDNFYSSEEILFDGQMDGLNGNEVRLDRYLAEKNRNQKPEARGQA